MMLRQAVLVLPLLVLIGCMDRPILTAPEGPVENVSLQSVTLTVQNLDDSGPGSLRQAILDAGNGHVITFASGIAGGMITLSSGELHINKSLTIVGPAGGITISGNNTTRIFRISNVYEVILDNLILTDGNSSSNPFPDYGGAILSFGNLTIKNSTIKDSWARVLGGAIEQGRGSLTIVNSTLSNNGVHPTTLEKTHFGGAIRMFESTVAVTNSTISGNTARDGGGGLVNNQSTLTLTHTTIAANGASNGGGIANYGESDLSAVTTLVNSIVARNTSGSASGGPDVYNVSIGGATPNDFVTLSASHSLVGEASGHNLTSTADTYVGVDPKFELDGLGKPRLADNGGSTKTHALLGDSPAIDAAGSTACTSAPVSSVDQRGVARPQGVRCDMGAYELVGFASPPPPTPSVDALSISASGTVNKTTGVAIISGTMSCSTAGVVQLQVELSQQQNQKRLSHTVTGSTTIPVDCSVASNTAWAAAVTAGNGVFVNGAVEAVGTALNADPTVRELQSVKLFWGK